jgi:hypothetical protein|tara:strand:+ start:194 stop:445 length:252 start_codon:yes stop_codon:yes gene_type:complete
MDEKYLGIKITDIRHAWGLIDTYYSFNTFNRHRNVPKMLRDNMGITKEQGAIIGELWWQYYDDNLTMEQRIQELKRIKSYAKN